MNAKKIYIIVICILIIILAIILWGYFNREEEVVNNVNEIVPEQEISDEQLRNTIVSLYFINSETGKIESESKLIDAKKLLINPYNELVNMWLMGPNNEKLKTYCGNNIAVNSVVLVDDCVILDFSRNFIDEFSGTSEDEIKVIYCLVNTLTELTEVNFVKILIDGQENQYLGNTNLSEKYCRLSE